MSNPNGNPNIVEAGQNTQITAENANEYRLKGLAIRRHLSEQKKVWESPADLPKEMAEFFGMFGFVGERQKLIDNKYKFAYKGLKKAYDKGDLNSIIKFFQMIGLDWAANAAQFIGKSKFIFTRVGNDSDKANP